MFEKTNIMVSVSNDDLKKKRGRKKKVVDDGEILITSESESVENNIQIAIEDNTISNDLIAIAAKKRGRKPKGGKLISKNVVENDKPQPVANVILHLKCSMKDLVDYNTSMNKMLTDPLNYNPDVPPQIKTYNNEESTASFSLYKNEVTSKPDNECAYLEENVVLTSKSNTSNNICSQCATKQLDNSEKESDDLYDDINIKDVNAKLKKLKVNLYKNTMPEKKSACFWCSYDFDNQTCYIPKYELDGKMCGYGSFCRPECAVAYLMKENIDDSTKFERYHLLNQIYSKVYDFKKNIKPAPNPYYLLDKFYGNMTIQEYRKLLKTEHMLLVIDKPLTRILPELHEDTDDFIMGIYGGSKGGATQAGGVYKVKKQSEKQAGPSKTSIIRDKFGLAQ